MLGLAKKTEDKKQMQATQAAPKTAVTSQADEAKAMLAKMEAKKDAGDCPFC